MTNPAPLGGDESPPPGSSADPLPVDEVPPSAIPPPAYESSELLEPTPAYDSLAAEAPLTDPMGTSAVDPDPLTAPVPPVDPAASTLTPEADYALAPKPGDAGPLAKVKAFAAEKPAAFIGAALAAGWLIGKLTSRGSDNDNDGD